MNIAYRAGRWSAAHWKTATLLWLAVVVCAVIGGRMAGTVDLTDSEQGSGQSALAQRMLNDSGFHNVASETVLVQSRRVTVSDPRFQRELRAVVERIRGLRQIDASAVAAGRRVRRPDLERPDTRRLSSSTCAATRTPPRIACSRC